MAQIQSESIVITFSKLVKGDTPADAITSEETLAALEQVSQELVAAGVIVEAVKA